MKSGISYLAIMFCLIATHFAFGQSNLNRLNTIHTVTFGDSLTDNELLFLLPAPFGNPDGPIVFGQDSVEALFTKAVGPEDQLTNFAVLGSVSGRGDCGYPFEQTCGVLSQVEEYVALRRAGAVASAAFISISLQAGGTDILDIENHFTNLFALASAVPNENWQVVLIIDQIKLNLLFSVFKLRSVGQALITLWTAPDVTLTPLVLSLALNWEQAAYIRAHVEDLNKFIRSLTSFNRRSSRPKLFFLDANRVLTINIFSPPEMLGTPILPPIVGVLGAKTNQFADPIHPSAVINAILANELVDVVNDSFISNVEWYSELEVAMIAGITAE